MYEKNWIELKRTFHHLKQYTWLEAECGNAHFWTYIVLRSLKFGGQTRDHGAVTAIFHYLKGTNYKSQEGLQVAGLRNSMGNGRTDVMGLPSWIV